MSNIRHVASTYAEYVSGTTSAVAYPSIIRAGDLILLTLFTANASTATNPSGFTQIANFYSVTNTQSPNIYVGYKIATGSESGTITVTHGSGVSQGGMSAFGGVDRNTPIDVTAGTSDPGSGSAALTFSALTLTRYGVAMVICASNSTTGNTSNAPTGYTELEDNPGGGRAGSVNYKLDLPSGSTGTITGPQFSGTGRRVGVAVPLRPAPPIDSVMIGA